MAERKLSNFVQIVSLTIENCLGCEKKHLNFSYLNSVHLLLYSLEHPNDLGPSSSIIVTPVGRALQLMCTLEYATRDRLRNVPELTLGRGSISMTFMLERLGGISPEYDPDSESDLDMEPSTSKQAMEHKIRRKYEKQLKRSNDRRVYEVNVQRRFDDMNRLDHIKFQFNANGWREMPIEEFYNIFFVRPIHSSEMLRKVHQHYASNWLRIIQADAGSYIKLRETGNPFDTFVKLLDQYCDGHDQELLKKLANYCLATQEKSRLVERRFILHVFEKVRSIFEYATNNEHTVLFFVSRFNRFAELDEVYLEDIDFNDVRTCIRQKRDNTNTCWDHADHNIMDIVMVAFQLALAHAGQQSVLFLGQLEKYTTASFMNGLHGKQSVSGASPKWYCPSYLHRIIEIAETLGVVVFIEYPDTLTLLPANRQITKCVQKLDQITGAITWNIKVDFTKAVTDIEGLKEAIGLQ